MRDFLGLSVVSSAIAPRGVGTVVASGRLTREAPDRTCLGRQAKPDRKVPDPMFDPTAMLCGMFRSLAYRHFFEETGRVARPQ